MLKDFLGNKETVIVLADWLSTYYHQPTKEIPNYAILFGSSGNGKSYLPTILAKEFGVELFHITPLDMASNDNLNNVIKSINSATLDNAKFKLILIDDIDTYSNFPIRYKSRLIEVGKMSKNPVIYTSGTYSLPFNASDSMKEQWSNFIKDSLKKVTRNLEGRIIWSKLLKIEKPSIDDLFNYLKSISKLPDDTLRIIAEGSKSVRSAILSIYNVSVNDLTKGIAIKGDILKSIMHRQLDEPLTRENIDYIFKAIRGYDKNAFDVMMKFAEFDYQMKSKFKKAKFNLEIDPIFVNEMKEPVDKVKFVPRFDKKDNDDKKEEVQKKPDINKKEQKPVIQEPTLGKWL